MEESAEYLIAQYLRNPMRREPRNVGVIVVLGDTRAAKFIGEIADAGEIDGRSTKWAAISKHVPQVGQVLARATRQAGQ